MLSAQSAPVAIEDSATTQINTPLLIDAPGVLSNDSDPDTNDIISVISFSINGDNYNAGETASFPEGNLSIDTDGSYIFNPATDYTGNIPEINYIITDGTFNSSANLNIFVFLPPEPPIARDDYDTADINTTLNVLAPGVLVNDTDVNEEDEITVTEFTINGISYGFGQTAVFIEGSLTIASDGSYSFIPTPDYIGDVPVINYTITDGVFTSSANLFLTVEPTEDLLEISFLGSCNQGFTASGEYKVRYTAILKNRSNARDYHEPSLIRNIDIRDDLQAAFGNECVVEVDEINVYNNNFTRDFINDGAYPREFNNDALNPNFSNVTSNSIFNETAINELILYPRQNITLVFCVTINPFCDGRPNPTPSGSGIDFNNTLSVSSNRGNAEESELLTDFHTTEAVVTAGLYVPEFNDTLEPPGVINPDGTYDYTNAVIITNEGTATANNFNYNMGLGSFLDNGIVFTELKIVQTSGPAVVINDLYDGDVETNLLAPNNSLAVGEKIVLELFYLIEPYQDIRYSYFYQLGKSQTQGGLDGFDENTAARKREYSFVTWSDNLGNHLDRYYKASSSTESVSSDLQCDCRRTSMRFLFTSSSSTTKRISEIKTSPNGILEQEEITFQITIENTSEAVQLRNLQLEDNLNNICGGNILSISTPFIQNSTAITNPILNPDFDGISNLDLFDGNSGILGANETITVEFSVLFNEICRGNNSATFTARDPLKIITSSGSTQVSSFTDTDDDGIANKEDLDDDNDTIPDILEYGGLNPLDDDDSDFIPNYRDTDFSIDANGDSIVDVFDFDNDGVPNHFDLDSDNDGILDIVELGNSSLDTNNNGRTNNSVGVNGLDNSVENNDSENAIITYTIPNTDSNGNPNYLDIDSDGDGIVDNIEGQSTESYITPNSIFSEAGIDTAYPNGINPVDTEDDTISDYLDTNADNDIRDDIIEGWDLNNDGIPETIPANSDLDNDGLDDAFDINNNLVNPSNGQTPISFPNVDNVDNEERDWREIIAIFILITDASEDEGGDLVFELSLVTKNNNAVLTQSASPIDIVFSTLDGTDTTNIYDVATSPFDYNSITNTSLTIPAFTETITFNVTTLEDPIFELSELFTLNGVITSENTINREITAIGTILDNDEAPSITMNDSSAEEGDDLEHTMLLSNPCSTPIIIEIVTRENLAVSPEDYTSIFEKYTIEGTTDPNNANSDVSFNISTQIDNLNELEEEFLNVNGLVLTANIGVVDLSKRGTIIDIDPNPLVAIDDVTAEEGKTLEFTISLLNAGLEPMQNYLPIAINIETVDDSTFGAEDYQVLNATISFPAFTSTFTQTINTVNDVLNEDTERFYLQANTSSLTTSNTFPPRGTGTILDNDYPNLFSPNGDGRSDVFKISGIREFPNFKLKIINRLGNEVFNYSNNGNLSPLWWDGTHNGNPVPLGVYYYTLDFNDGVTKPKVSFIQLIR
jgi:gliding motility-associated-like protein